MRQIFMLGEITDYNTSILSSAIANFLPLLIFIGVVFFLIRAMNKKRKKYTDECAIRMASIDENIKKIVNLLEKDKNV